MTFLVRLFEKLQRRSQRSLLHKHPKVKFKSLKLGTGDHFVLASDLKIVELGQGLELRNYVQIRTGKGAALRIGDNVFFNNFCSVNCLDQIEIGENTLFGENVKIYDHNHKHQQKPHPEVFHSEFTTAPVKIGKNCWLGSNVTVLKGVTIGDNCIIGAGCVIYNDIPANSTVVNQQNLITKIR